MLEFYLFSIAKMYLHYLYMHFKGILICSTENTKNQSELKNIIIEMKNTLEELTAVR